MLVLTTRAVVLCTWCAETYGAFTSQFMERFYSMKLEFALAWAAFVSSLTLSSFSVGSSSCLSCEKAPGM